MGGNYVNRALLGAALSSGRPESFALWLWLCLPGGERWQGILRQEERAWGLFLLSPCLTHLWEDCRPQRQLFSKCASWTSSITWKLFINANLGDPPQTCYIINSGVGNLCPLGDSDTCENLRTAGLGSRDNTINFMWGLWPVKFLLWFGV